MTATYLKWLLLFSPAFILNDILLCFVRNDDNPRLAMTAMIIGSFSNIILDYIFIFPMKTQARVFMLLPMRLSINMIITIIMTVI